MDSLELLLNSNPDVKFRFQPKSQPKTHSSDADLDVLGNLTTRLLESFNTHDFDPALLEHIGPELNDIQEQNPIVTTPEEHVAHMYNLMSVRPKRHVKTVNVSGFIDTRLGRATVYATSVMTGEVDDFFRERVDEVNWIRRWGVWKVLRRVMLKGGGGFLDHDQLS